MSVTVSAKFSDQHFCTFESSLGRSWRCRIFNWGPRAFLIFLILGSIKQQHTHSCRQDWYKVHNVVECTKNGCWFGWQHARLPRDSELPGLSRVGGHHLSTFLISKLTFDLVPKHARVWACIISSFTRLAALQRGARRRYHTFFSQTGKPSSCGTGSSRLSLSWNESYSGWVVLPKVA